MKRRFNITTATGLLLALLGSPSIFAAQLKLGLALYGASSDAERAQSRIAGTEVGASFFDRPVEKLSLQLSALANLETGSTRRLYSDEFNPRQGMRLREASLSYSPIDAVTLSAGALDQDRWAQPLLFANQSFPALLEKLEWGENFFARFEAMQSFASDTSTLQPWNEIGDTTSQFFIERVSLGWRNQRENQAGFHATAHASHYLFENLSPTTAYHSRFLGNSVVGTALPASKFLTSLSGYEFGVSTHVPVTSNWNGHFNFAYLFNPQALADKGQGYRGEISVGYRFSDNFKSRFGGEYYSVDADISPAIYNSKKRGHNNREGFSVKAAALWESHKTEIEAEWFQSNVKQANSLQEDFQWIQVTARTSYDIW